ncbi:hypothetical protein BKA62DRAFT_743293 [Auriculariales sp. MPI-PUGE-AT-0066]|nr:hypothetical protein BKA62DRAFT_743293 [Auriculariales sp. MPI-PUGE-AT-0066]
MWLSDGSVILATHDMLFRVHKSQLARHSVVFRDMFAMPAPVCTSPPSTEPLEGCDVVHLHDAWQDVESLLHALYDGPSFGNNNEADFAVVSGILRLSNKYLIEPLRSRCIAHLSVAWPPTLTGWDAREEFAERALRGVQSPRSDGSMPATPPADVLHPFDRTHSYYPHASRVLALAREVGATALLPSAFYDLTRYSFAQLLSSSVASSLSLGGSPRASLDAIGIPDVDPSQDTLELAPADFRRLALGKEAASLHILSLIRSMSAIRSLGHAHAHSHSGGHGHLHTRPPLCSTPAACRKDFVELAEMATQHYVLDRHYGNADPLYVADEVGQLKSAELGSQTECRACGLALEAWAQRERERIWRLLPSWFRLDGWDNPLS